MMQSRRLALALPSVLAQVAWPLLAVAELPEAGAGACQEFPESPDGTCLLQRLHSAQAITAGERDSEVAHNSVHQPDPGAQLMDEIAEILAGSDSGLDIEGMVDDPCDVRWCTLRKVSAPGINKWLTPGTGPMKSFQGIFWFDGGCFPLRVITFAGWKPRYYSDGTFGLTGKIYSPKTAGFATGLLNWGLFSPVFYKLLSMSYMRVLIKCILRNGDVSTCQVLPILGGMFPMSPNSFLNITLEREPGDAVSFRCRTNMFGVRSTFRMRQIFTGFGKRVRPAYTHYMFKEPFWKHLLVAQPTLLPRITTQILAGLLQSIGNLLVSLIGLVLLIGESVLDFLKTDFDPAVPTLDVYEYKLNSVRPFDAMCPLKTYDGYVIAAFDVAGGGYSGPEFSSFLELDATQIMQKTISALDAVQKLVRAWIWKQAQDHTGGPVNPATSLWLKEHGPFSGISWYDFSNFLLAFVTLPAFVLGSGGDRVIAFTQWAQVTCFEPTVLALGPQVFQYDKVREVLIDPLQSRGYYTATSPSAPYIFNSDGAIFLSSGSAQHTAVRSAYKSIGLAQSFEVPIDKLEPMELKPGDLFKRVGEFVLPTVMSMVWGEWPPENVTKAVSDYLSFGAIGIFGKVVGDFLLRPLGVSKTIISQRRAAFEWASQTDYAVNVVLKDPEVKEYIRTYPISEDSEIPVPPELHFLQNIVDITLFAGYVGTTHLVSRCVQTQKDDPSLRPLFEEDPEAFIVEVMRVDSAVTSVTALLPEDSPMILEGLNITMGRGTPFQAVIATANMDLSHWEDPHVINPKRNNLGDTLSWNGPARYVEAQDFEKAPRHCPGYCASIKAGAAICAKLMGSWDDLTARGKIGGSVSCSSFNHDCRGEWSEWGECSAPCEVGQRKRTYKVIQPAAGKGGRQCEWLDGAVQTQACNEHLCGPSCLEEGQDGECKVQSWQGVKESCTQAFEIPMVLAATLGAQLHYQDWSQANVSSLTGLLNMTMDDLRAALDTLLPPAGVATWDVEAFDEFTVMTYFTIVFLGLESSALNSSALNLPTETKTVGSFRVGPSAIAPLYDIDMDSGFLAGSLDVVRCAFAYFRDLIVWRDDLDVTMRNRWDLVMQKAKYYTPEIEEKLGHPFRRYKDYIRQIFIWYVYPDTGNPLYPEWWDVARHFLRDYDEIYSGPSRIGEYHKLPAVYEDTAEKWLAFSNAAQHLVEVLDQNLAHGGETAVYVVRTACARAAPVRAGFDLVGADMYFSQDGMPLAVSDGQALYWRDEVKPEEWQYWKFVWRASFSTLTTIKEHLLYSHMATANIYATASRQVLSPTHPFRRFMKRFTFGSIFINGQAQNFIFSSKTVGGRAFPFADQNKAVGLLWQNLSTVWDTFLPLRDPSTLPDKEQYRLMAEMPYYTNGTKVYSLLQGLLVDFLKVYKDDWCKDGEVIDQEIIKFDEEVVRLAEWMGIGGIFDIPDKAPGTPDLGCAWLERLEARMSGVLFQVSAYHAQVGTVAHMYIDPEFASFSWREGERIGPVKQHLMTEGLGPATTKDTPKLVEDYTHLCVGILHEDACRSIFNKFQAEFQRLGNDIDKANEGNPLYYMQMSPNFIENSIAK